MDLLVEQLLLAYLLNYTKGYNISKSMFYMDSVIILASVFTIGVNQHTLYFLYSSIFVRKIVEMSLLKVSTTKKQ